MLLVVFRRTEKQILVLLSCSQTFPAKAVVVLPYLVNFVFNQPIKLAILWALGCIIVPQVSWHSHWLITRDKYTTHKQIILFHLLKTTRKISLDKLNSILLLNLKIASLSDSMKNVAVGYRMAVFLWEHHLAKACL